MALRGTDNLADLIRDHDMRSSFKTKAPVTAIGQDTPSLASDFKDIIRRSRLNNRYFLLREYPEVLLEGRSGSYSMLFH